MAGTDRNFWFCGLGMLFSERSRGNWIGRFSRYCAVLRRPQYVFLIEVSVETCPDNIVSIVYTVENVYAYF